MKKAILIILCIALNACSRIHQTTTDTTSPSHNEPPTGLIVLQNDAELSAYLRSKNISIEATEQRATAPSNIDPIEDAAPTGVPVSEVVVQEGDIYKIQDNRLVIVNSTSGLLVYDVSKTYAPRRVGHLTLQDFTTQEMFIHKNLVVLVGNKIDRRFVGEPLEEDPNQIGRRLEDSQESTTPEILNHIRVYDIQDPSRISLKKEYATPGLYAQSRQVGSSLFVASQETRILDSNNSPLFGDLRCRTMYAPEDLSITNGVYALWYLSSLNLENLPETPGKTCFAGTFLSTIHATPEHLYLTTYNGSTDSSQIALFGISTDASIKALATASIPGLFVNQFSMDETDGIFRIATTTNRLTRGADDNRNHLTTFRIGDHRLEKLADLDTIVPGESITAVRFAGKKAFITTFVTSDPLLAIDLENPENPRLLGELHLPGMALHIEAWGNFLVALGQSSQFSNEVVLNLFDVTDAHQPRLVEQETLSDAYGSEAQWDHRAFSFFQEHGLIALPVTRANESTLSVYRVSPTEGFTPVTNLSHEDLTQNLSSTFSPRMRRSFEVGNSLYTLSEAGLKIYDFTNLNEPTFGELFPDITPPTVCGCTEFECVDCFFP